jgi:prepilin-type processing-associated H-X9-DG protein
MSKRNRLEQAFTVLELLVVATVLTFLVLITLPALANTKAGVQRVYCSNNLKQVGLAFHTWATKNNNRFPTFVPGTEGGANTAVGVAANTYNNTAFAANYPAAGPRGVFGMFVVMSNELKTPKILYCPSEANGNIVQASVFGNTVGTTTGFNSDSYASYFVGVDANENAPSRFLAGDHNLGTGNNQATHVSQFVSAGTNAAWTTTAIGWQNNQHAQKGNVLFVDGSVQRLNTPQLREMLNKTGDLGRTAGVFANAPGSVGTGVNRLQMPRIN